MKKFAAAALCFCLFSCLAACGGKVGTSCPATQGGASSQETSDVQDKLGANTESGGQDTAAESELEDDFMNMKIGETAVEVVWEDNGAVDALRALCAQGPLSIEMHMYGGFEQVGDIGSTLPSEDEQTTTQAGDVVLYSGDQLVIFYSSNSWAYTRLGRVTDRDAEGMRALLSGGDVTVTITAG